MASPLIVHISRRVLRQLQLGKGMFFDAEAMEDLAVVGVWDHVHRAGAEYQREEVARRRAEREEQHLKAFEPARTSSPSPVRAEPNDHVEEAFARARRALGTRRKVKDL